MCIVAVTDHRLCIARRCWGERGCIWYLIVVHARITRTGRTASTIVRSHDPKPVWSGLRRGAVLTPFIVLSPSNFHRLNLNQMEYKGGHKHSAKMHKELTGHPPERDHQRKTGAYLVSALLRLDRGAALNAELQRQQIPHIMQMVFVAGAFKLIDEGSVPANRKHTHKCNQTQKVRQCVIDRKQRIERAGDGAST